MDEALHMMRFGLDARLLTRIYVQLVILKYAPRLGMAYINVVTAPHLWHLGCTTANGRWEHTATILDSGIQTHPDVTGLMLPTRVMITTMDKERSVLVQSGTEPNCEVTVKPPISSQARDDIGDPCNNEPRIARPPARWGK
jgi:hypothetical protein